MTQTISITDDTYVDQANATTNYGTATTLDVYYSGATEKYALLDIPWSSISTPQEVVKAELKLYVTSNPDSSSLVFDRITSAWTEGSVTWDTKPTDANIDLFETITNTSAHWHTFNITTPVGSWNDGLYSYYGLSIHKSTDDTSSQISFASSDHGTSAYHPYIEATSLADVGYEYTVFSDIYDVYYTVWYPTMTSIVDNVDTNQSTYEIEVQIQAPWQTSVSTYYLDVGEQQAFSDIQAGYTDHFIVENYSTSYSTEIGYYPVIAVAYYREYNQRYVKTDGNDSNSGRSWDFAFASNEKGFEETPNGGQLYVESGAYSETLSSLDLPSGNTSLNYIPMDKTHTSSATATVVIDSGTVTDIGDESSAGSASGSGSYTYNIYLTDDFTIPSNIIAQLFHAAILVPNGSACRVRFVAYRYSGGTYTRIALSQWTDSYSNSTGSSVWKYFYDLLIGQEITTGDFIGVQLEQITPTCQIAHEVSVGDTIITYLTNTEDVTSFTTVTQTRNDEILKCRVQYFS